MSSSSEEEIFYDAEDDFVGGNPDESTAPLRDSGDDDNISMSSSVANLIDETLLGAEKVLETYSSTSTFHSTSTSSSRRSKSLVIPAGITLLEITLDGRKHYIDEGLALRIVNESLSADEVLNVLVASIRRAVPRVVSHSRHTRKPSSESVPSESSVGTFGADDEQRAVGAAVIGGLRGKLDSDFMHERDGGSEFSVGEVLTSRTGMEGRLKSASDVLTPMKNMFGKLLKKGSTNSDSISNIPAIVDDRVTVHVNQKSQKELTNIRMVQKIQGHQGAVWVMKFSDCGKFLASGGQDNAVYVWQVLDGEEPYGNGILGSEPAHTFRGHTAEVLDLAWSKLLE